MKRRFLILLMVVLMVLPSAPFCFADAYANVQIDGKNVNFTYDDGIPFIEYGRTLVPLRKTMETLGCTVTWNNKTKTASVSKNGMNVDCIIGSYVILRNSEYVQIDVAPVIKNGRTYLPIRAVAESFGYNVDYDSSSKTVIIASSITSVNNNETLEAQIALLDSDYEQKTKDINKQIDKLYAQIEKYEKDYGNMIDYYEDLIEQERSSYVSSWASSASNRGMYPSSAQMQAVNTNSYFAASSNPNVIKYQGIISDLNDELEYNCGLCYDAIDELEAELADITDSYKTYRETLTSKLNQNTQQKVSTVNTSKQNEKSTNNFSNSVKNLVKKYGVYDKQNNWYQYTNDWEVEGDKMRGTLVYSVAKDELIFSETAISGTSGSKYGTIYYLNDNLDYINFECRVALSSGNITYTNKDAMFTGKLKKSYCLGDISAFDTSSNQYHTTDAINKELLIKMVDSQLNGSLIHIDYILFNLKLGGIYDFGFINYK